MRGAVSKWKLPISIKYGVFMLGLFAAAEGSTLIWREGGFQGLTFLMREFITNK